MANKRRKRKMAQEAKVKAEAHERKQTEGSGRSVKKRTGRSRWKSLVVPTGVALLLGVLSFGLAAYLQDTWRSSTEERLNQIETLDLLESFPHDPSAFTQGLLYHDGYLYESAGGWGASSLRKVNITTGEVVQRRDLESRYFGEGLELVGDKLYQLTWKAQLGFVYDLHTFDRLSTWDLKTTTNDGWGIAYDGTNFLITDGSEFLHVTEPKEMKLVRRIPVTMHNGRAVRNLNELEYIGNNQVLANIWFSNLVARIELTTGKVIRWYNLTEYSLHTGGEDVLNGLAYSPEEKALYATGKTWNKLYKLQYF